MKLITIMAGVSLMLLSSCTTSLVNQRKPYNDNKLKLGKSYIFTTQDGKKYNIDVSKIDSLTLYGRDNTDNLVQIKKSEINTIKKHNVAGTLGIIAGGIAAVVIIPSYISNKPIGK
ncbi:hypothetical protein [Chryseobacterium sp.]|uniref:hypothetical protein n=1 Tax=Chryseobacterium sp. TaxID=1871047 RepID=UPI0025BE4D31|nr:hypothetical protein [Chryseobacterium sp.]MBV8325496.1 hypothetical protein [Chryseobacterium sp.]